MIYLIGSLRNPRIPAIANDLRAQGFDVFDDWYAAGEKADDAWQTYEQGKGHTFAQALKGDAAKNVFAFDYRHLLQASTVILALPAGKSGHLEFGWMRGRGIPGYILLDKEPERFDVMYQFATGVFNTLSGLVRQMQLNGQG